MAAEPPVSRLVLRATSVADDLGFVALADIALVLAAGPQMEHRVIGGHMVTGLIHRWGLGAELQRQTGDADLGVPPFAVQDSGLIDRLFDLGYQRRGGNRFARPMNDLPVGLAEATGSDSQPEAVIDILVPAYRTRARTDRKFGDHLVTTEVPGLATAFQRPQVSMSFELHRLNGEVTAAELDFPDEVSAVVLKGFATQVRSKDTDVSDVWRCLEVAFAAGVSPDQFAAGEPADGAAIVQSLFADRNGPGMLAVVREQGLSGEAADQRFTRIRALVGRVLS